MKTLVYQYYISQVKDGTPPEWVNISVRKFKEYAKKHGSEYIFETHPRYSSFYFEHLYLIYKDYFQQFDKILYVDVDVIPENLEENIFDIPFKDIAAVPEHKVVGMTRDPSFQTMGWANEY